jgi:hypothetical protein
MHKDRNNLELSWILQLWSKIKRIEEVVKIRKLYKTGETMKGEKQARMISVDHCTQSLVEMWSHEVFAQE